MDYSDTGKLLGHSTVISWEPTLQTQSSKDSAVKETQSLLPKLTIWRERRHAVPYTWRRRCAQHSEAAWVL